MLGLWVGITKYKQGKESKKKMDEELLPLAWHPTRVQNWCM